MKISVIATGFDEARRRLREYIGTGVGSASLGQQPASWTRDDTATNNTHIQQVAPKEEEIEEEKQIEEDEDLEIPAFLRSNR